MRDVCISYTRSVVLLQLFLTGRSLKTAMFLVLCNVCADVFWSETPTSVLNHELCLFLDYCCNGRFSSWSDSLCCLS